MARESWYLVRLFAAGSYTAGPLSVDVLRMFEDLVLGAV